MTDPFNVWSARTLRDLGAEVMFGVMGDANMYIADAFHREPGGRFVAAANEGGAVQMAAGYAAVTGRVGVATVTHGAVANTVSALFDAVRGGYPLVVIAGDTARSEAYHLQNIPQREVVAPTGAGYRPVRSVETVVVDLAAAFAEALATRRPIVVEIPSDFHQAPCEPVGQLAAAVHRGPVAPTRTALEEAAALVIGSDRPLLVAGWGAAGAGKPLRELAERIGAPVMTTLRGKGLFGGDPADLGIFGTLSDPTASEAIAQADCLLMFGASVSALTTLRGELLAGKKVIHIDDAPGAHGRYFPSSLGLVADCAVTATALVEILDEAEAPPARFRASSVVERHREGRAEDRRSADAAGPLTLTGVLHRIDRLVDPARSLTVDGGRFSHEALRVVGVEAPRHYAHCLNVGHIGLGVGYGIGAAVGRPDHPCLVVVGDGGFMLGGIAEFNTAVRAGVPLVVCLLNDEAYGAEYYRFVGQGLDPALTTFDWPGFAELAVALGGRGVRVDTWDDFAAVESALAQDAGPLLIEVRLDRDAIPDPGDH